MVEGACVHRVRGKLLLPRRRQSFSAVCNTPRAALVCSGGTTTTHSLSAHVTGASVVVLFSFCSCRCRGHHGCRVITSLHTRVVHFTHLAKKKMLASGCFFYRPFLFCLCIAAGFPCCLFTVDFWNGCKPLAVATTDKMIRVCAEYGDFFLPHTCAWRLASTKIYPCDCLHKGGCCRAWHG